MSDSTVTDHDGSSENKESRSEVEEIRAALKCEDDTCSCQRNGKVHCPVPTHEDKHPSFSVDLGDAQPVVVHCHSRCSQDDVIAALRKRGVWSPASMEPVESLGLTLREYAEAKQLPINELRSYGIEQAEGYPPRSIRMPYVDEHGVEVAVRRRRALTGSDRFFWEKDSRPTLYGLWNRDEVRELKQVVLVEGESDCHTLWHYGILAFGIPGASMWKDEKFADLLDGIDLIYLVVEPDQGGQTLLKSLEGSSLREQIHLIEPDGFEDPSDLHLQDPDQFKVRWQGAMDAARPLPEYMREHQDADESEVGGVAEEAPRRSQAIIVEDIDAPPEQTPGPVAGPVGEGVSRTVESHDADDASQDVAVRRRYGGELLDETPTDMSNADSFASAHSHEARYVHGWKSWIFWDGKRWKRDDSDRVVEMAKEHASSLAADALERLNLRDAQAHIKRVQSGAGLANTIKLAQSDPLIAVESALLDTHDHLLNFTNGTLDLREGEERGHDPDDLITQLVPFRYGADVESTVWNRFLKSVLPDEDERAYLQRAMGHLLVGRITEDKVIFIVGPTGTGKTSFTEAVRNALGNDYSMPASIDTFVKGHRPGAPRPDLAQILRRRIRLVTASEASEGMELDAAVMKQLAGGDATAFRTHHKEPVPDRARFTLLIHTNYFPQLPDDDDAMWRRVTVLGFDQQFSGETLDGAMRDRLQEPDVAEAILAWMVQGCRDWLEQGLNPPESVKAAVAAYRQQMDPLAGWFAEHCVKEDGAWTSSAALWDSFEEFHGRGRTPVSKTQFGTRLKGMGFEPAKRQGGTRGYLNIKLS